MCEAKYVEDRKYLNKEIPLEIVPIRVFRAEEFCYTSLIRIAKQVHQVLVWVLEKQIIFLDAVVVKTPGVHHLCMVAIINSNPAIKNPRHYFQEENNDELRIT